MSILKVQNLTKTYGKGDTLVKAVDDVSFTVEKKEFIAILGASGSGKSTLLHMIGGVDTPTSGKVLVNDVDIYSLNDESQSHLRRTEVSIIYQFYNLISTLNVKENITLPLDLDGSVNSLYHKLPIFSFIYKYFSIFCLSPSLKKGNFI